jgi:hypothetical protein
VTFDPEPPEQLASYGYDDDGLEELTRERELILSASTYSQRQTVSSLLPGALVSRLTLTL